MMELLPDLPGTITGIKCKNPFIVQCPTCGDCYMSRAWTIAAHCVPFWDYKDRPKLRQCLDCWARDGWARSDYGGSVFGGSPADAMRLLDRNHPSRHAYRISTEEARALIETRLQAPVEGN